MHGKRDAEAWEIGALAHVLELELADLLGFSEAMTRMAA